MSTVIEETFTSFQIQVEIEQELREQIRTVVKALEHSARDIINSLQVIHYENAITSIPQSCLEARELFENVRNGFRSLAQIIPAGQYYRYNDMWRFVTQRLCFLASLIIFLEVGTLLSKTIAAEILGVNDNSDNGFHLDLEDYLIGILLLASELSRFAVNSVTNGDYGRPIQISKFVGDLNAGFRTLNLKNDSLRKRFDALKYDVKKIEEVVYDVSIRGLLHQPQDTETNE